MHISTIWKTIFLGHNYIKIKGRRIPGTKDVLGISASYYGVLHIGRENLGAYKHFPFFYILSIAF